MKHAIIIGATSGMGKALAKLLLADGWKVAVTGRRAFLLEDIQQHYPGQTLIKAHDIRELNDSQTVLNDLFLELNTVDLVVVSSGIGELNQKLQWDIEQDVIQTNVNGVAKVYQSAFLQLKAQNHGHLVGITSLASIRGTRHGPSYNASKAFQSNYLEGLRGIVKNEHLKITITDVQPGFVATPMAKGDGLFWVASPQKAARQIYRGIKKGKRKVYITKRWRVVAWILKLLPSWIYEKL